MKKTIKLLGLVLGCVAMLTACSDDNDSNPIANRAPSELILNTPAVADQYIELTDSTTISFTWSEPDFGYSALATYRFQVGVVQQDGSVKWDEKDGAPNFLDTPYNIWNADVSAEEIAMSISNIDGFKTIDDYVDMGIRTIAFRVYGNIRSGEREDIAGTGVFSNAVYLKNVQSYAVVKEPGWIYICGNLTGWKEPGMANKEFYDASWRITETGVGTNIFKASLNLDRQDGDYIQFRFYTALTGWDTDSSIGLSENTDLEFDADGKYSGAILSNGRYEGNYKFTVASAGTLDITVNLNTNKVEFVFTPNN